VNALKKTSFSSKFSLLFAEQLATAPFSDAQRTTFGRKKKKKSQRREDLGSFSLLSRVQRHFRISLKFFPFSHLSPSDHLFFRKKFAVFVNKIKRF
jgi:hypothetical protein